MGDANTLFLVILEERRTLMRAAIREIWKKGIDDACGPLDHCCWGKERNARYQVLLLRYPSLSMLELPVSRLIEESTQVPIDDPESEQHFSRSQNRMITHHALAHSYTFKGQMEDMEKELSLCFDSPKAAEDLAIERIVNPDLTHAAVEGNATRDNRNNLNDYDDVPALWAFGDEDNESLAGW